MLINSLLIILAIASSTLFITIKNWYWRIAILAIVQLIGFILISQIWPIALASLKLISGWMGSLLLGYSLYQGEETSEKEYSISLILFRGSIVCLICLFLAGNVSIISQWLPIETTSLYIGLLFFFTGIISFSLFKHPIEIIMGLLIFLSGFDVIYSSLEGSALVTVIYALIVILISLVGIIMRDVSMGEV